MKRRVYEDFGLVSLSFAKAFEKGVATPTAFIVELEE